MGCMSSKAKGDGDVYSDQGQHDGGGYSTAAMGGSLDDRDQGSQSDMPPESSVACELGTNAEGRSEAAFSRSSAQSGVDSNDAAVTDHWSMQNDEIAANAQSPDDSGPHDSFVYTPTEVSRDEQWATRSTGTAGDAHGEL